MRVTSRWRRGLHIADGRIYTPQTLNEKGRLAVKLRYRMGWPTWLIDQGKGHRRT